MLKPWQFISFFLLCLLLALLFNWPIKQVLPHLRLPGNVDLIGVQGTAIKGTARQINIEQFPLRAVSYRFLPSCTLLLKACYEINYDQGTIQFAYDVLNGDTEISDARVEYPVAELIKLLPNLPLIPVGQIELVIDDLSILQGKPTALIGKLIWRDMGLDDDVKINLGDYQIDFSGDQQKYDFKLSDLEASLEVTGTGDVRADGQYSVDIKIAAENGIDSYVKNVLDLVATKAGYNQYRFEQKGRLPAHLTRQLFR
jgi:hypothetical protein